MRAQRLRIESEFSEKYDAWKEETGLDKIVEEQDIAERGVSLDGDSDQSSGRVRGWISC